MAHYMFQFRYSESSMKAMASKPQDRQGPVKTLIESYGGKLLQFYFAFGEFDGVVIYEMPDNTAATALAMAVAATGATSHSHTTVLMTAKEAEEAMKKAHETKTGYKPPHA